MKYRMTIKDGSPTVNTSTEYFNATGGPDGMGAWQTFHYHSPKVAINMFLSNQMFYQKKVSSEPKSNQKAPVYITIFL